MGVYHFMGLGRSVGAVTAALSYLAARYARDNPQDRAFFALSGEVNQPADRKRGDVQALVLFTTEEIYDGNKPSNGYILNQPGQCKGPQKAGERVSLLLERLAREDLRTLTITSRDPAKAAPRKEIEVYWCLYRPDQPTETFERVASTISAAKAPGALGKEVWINLTGGTNIINSALQLSVGLLGVSARLYYIWSEHTDCVAHTVHRDDLGTERDTFWVDLPILYFDFNENHRCILETLEKLGEPVSVDDLHNIVANDLGGELPGGTRQERLVWFRRLFVLPLRAQQLITGDERALTIDRGWERLKRYYSAIPQRGQAQPNLSQLTADNDWLLRETWELG
ncbi:MAG: hypothetical protein Kow00120_08230 [Anaerolineae bacterium]